MDCDIAHWEKWYWQVGMRIHQSLMWQHAPLLPSSSIIWVKSNSLKIATKVLLLPLVSVLIHLCRRKATETLRSYPRYAQDPILDDKLSAPLSSQSCTAWDLLSSSCRSPAASVSLCSQHGRCSTKARHKTYFRSWQRKCLRITHCNLQPSVSVHLYCPDPTTRIQRSSSRWRGGDSGTLYPRLLTKISKLKTAILSQFWQKGGEKRRESSQISCTELNAILPALPPRGWSWREAWSVIFLLHNTQSLPVCQRCSFIMHHTQCHRTRQTSPSIEESLLVKQTALFYSRCLGLTQQCRFLVCSQMLLSCKLLFNKQWAAAEFLLSSSKKKKKECSAQILPNRTFLFLPAEHHKPCSNDSLWQLSENMHSKFIWNVQKEQIIQQLSSSCS